MSDEEQKSNLWPWVVGGVGVGCLGCVGAIALVVGGGFWFGMRTLDEPMSMTDDELRRDPEALRLLGANAERAWQDTDLSLHTGKLNAQLSVNGELNGGKLTIAAEKHGDEWRFDELVLEVDGERVDLLPLEPAPEPATDEH